jgi:hypothetical protein
VPIPWFAMATHDPAVPTTVQEITELLQHSHELRESAARLLVVATQLDTLIAGRKGRLPPAQDKKETGPQPRVDARDTEGSLRPDRS